MIPRGWLNAAPNPCAFSVLPRNPDGAWTVQQQSPQGQSGGGPELRTWSAVPHAAARQLFGPVQHRCAGLVQPSEGQLHLRLHARHAHDAADQGIGQGIYRRDAMARLRLWMPSGQHVRPRPDHDLPGARCHRSQRQGGLGCH
jgi:hypothetical protein